MSEFHMAVGLNTTNYHRPPQTIEKLPTHGKNKRQKVKLPITLTVFKITLNIK